MRKFICIHGHFYQPPRENPWLEAIEPQDSAYPYHDWNQRITFECYAPNTAARVVDCNQMIIDIINNYSKISFNFGPTLLSWMQKSEPHIYETIIRADFVSREKFAGHGSAIAQCYSHMIMPLANSKDKKTQVIWGIKDFESRFERLPEGMWLPETAVDDESLDLMAQNGIKFTILSPYQVKQIKKIDEENFHDISFDKIDCQLPYLYRLPSNRSIIIFFYDGKISHDMAFSGLLTNGDYLANRLIQSFLNNEQERLVNVAIDGETFGHHKQFADMALAYCLKRLENEKDFTICSYGQFLSKTKPVYEVKIYQNSAWSCSHGVGRWFKDCGCALDPHSGYNQKWREHLRNALDWLRDQLIMLFEKKMLKYFENPWQIRDEYIEVILNRAKENINDFLKKHTQCKFKESEIIQILQLLEMQRYAMAMYTSCGWFFDDVSRIETIQILQYAARAIQLAQKVDNSFYEDNFIILLEKAISNIKELHNAAYIYKTIVKPKVLDLQKVSMHFSIFSLFERKKQKIDIYFYSIKTTFHEVLFMEDNKKLSYGNADILCKLTLEKLNISFVALYYGRQNVLIGISKDQNKKNFLKTFDQLKIAFLSDDIAKTKEIINSYFILQDLSFWDLFKDEKRAILKRILKSTISEIQTSLQNIHTLNYSLVSAMRDRKLPIPDVLITSLDLMLNAQLLEVLDKQEANVGQLKKILGEIKKWSFTLNVNDISHRALNQLIILMQEFSKDPYSLNILNKLNHFLEIFSSISLPWNLWKAQNIYFNLMKKIYEKQKKSAINGGEKAKIWLEAFKKLGKYLSVKI